jgi:putative nucleotidyltransferase with HDIG domain
MLPKWFVRKINACQAATFSIAIVLVFSAATLRGQQVEPESSPPVQPQAEQSPATPSQAPPAAAQSDSERRPEAAPQTQERKSPLDQLDDFEPRAKASPPPATAEAESLHVLLGRPLVVSSPVAISQVSVADPNIIDVVVLSRNEVLVNGKQRGRVSLVLKDATGQSQGFDINVECDPPAVPNQLLAALAGRPAPGEAPQEKKTWIYWVVAGSIVLVGGTVLGARRHRGQRFFQLKLQSQGSRSLGLGLLVEPAVDLQEARGETHAEAENTSGFPAGDGTASVAGETGNAERNERLLEEYLEAATRGMFPAAPDLRRDSTPLAQQPSSSQPINDSGSQPCDESPVTGASTLQPQPLLDTITALAFAVDAKGPYATGHSHAVSKLAARIAIQAGLSVAEVEETRLAGLVHDIGKIHVPDSLCNKPDRLTPEEFEMMSRHSAWGAEMLEPLNVKTIENIVRHHHERFDGQGYPDRLAADKIPLGARIVAVAESFHCMLSDLPYKSACTFEDAMAELRRGSGMQFDPRIVMAFLDWIQSYTVSPEHQKA